MFKRFTHAIRDNFIIYVDGEPVDACEGDTILSALLSEIGFVRLLELKPEKRAGFCLMGACQDCWLWHLSGERARACTERVLPGMRLSTSQPGSVR
ncbi:2Fe-2S iron-sulfur cluster binding domain-containing protein [Rhizobium mongolense subsp. loessense]|uniref:2Fe-2S iron-sulfur cluster binding domain-containing protein n=1 Tax=Rhizobium mongolense subsp. loessense TaxID=158890 RepID=A0A1G4SBL5_9HYPH|nr:(2Fe-2S)-binding protein [Rhizobium mongolense]SCW66612.1 2Fe-2S iron-sulfur cluster binding domain-containing protein [Rhizobium mongolense subsp. loessense]